MYFSMKPMGFIGMKLDIGYKTKQFKPLFVHRKKGGDMSNIEYTYIPEQVRFIPSEHTSLTPLERQILDQLDELTDKED